MWQRAHTFQTLVSRNRYEKVDATSFPGSLSFASLVNHKGGRGERAWERGWGRCNISNTKDRVWPHFQTPSRELKVDVIYQTLKTVFGHISKHREESWTYDAQRSILDELRGAWKYGQTLSWVFDISTQSKLKLRRIKTVKIYACWDQISKRRHGYLFSFVWN